MQVRGVHPPIVREAEFQQVQEVLRSHFNAPMHRHTYLLQGRLIVCSTINHTPIPMSCATVSAPKRRYYYWYDGKRRRHIPAIQIDTPVVDAMQRRVRPLGTVSSDEIARHIRRAIAEAYEDVTRQITVLDEQRKRVLHQAATGRFSDAEVAGEVNRIEGARTALVAHAARIHDQREREREIIAVWQNIYHTLTTWNERSDTEQHALFQQLVDEVEVNTEGIIQRITWSPIWDQLLVTEEERTVGG
jgi:hypothetical protein